MSKKKRTFNHGDYETRRRKALERLETENPTCPACGEQRWQCMDLDHAAGIQIDDLVVIICANCHRIKTDAQKDWPQRSADNPPDMLERIGYMLLGLAEFFKLFVERLQEFGRYLIAFARKAKTSGAVS